MANGFLDFLQNRPEAVFLPVVSFGYPYTEYDSLSKCLIATELLPTLELSPYVFLYLAIVGTVVSSFMYRAKGEPDKPSEPGDIVSIPILTSFIHPLLMVLSFVELAIRVCSNDTIVVGLTLLYVALLIIGVTEKLYV